jgi:hypothetical protein
MASRMIGRTACPECGFAAAHVKESEKCLYRYCPECGSQHHARTERQRADLTAKTRTLEGSATPTPTPAAIPTATPTATGETKPSATPTQEPSATPTAQKPPVKRGALFF